jgi:hypothetical protein
VASGISVKTSRTSSGDGLFDGDTACDVESEVVYTRVVAAIVVVVDAAAAGVVLIDSSLLNGKLFVSCYAGRISRKD